MAKFCENCGMQLNPDDEKCPSCGAATGVSARTESTESAGIEYEKSNTQVNNQGNAQQGYRPPYTPNGQGYNGGYNQYRRPYQTPTYNQYSNPYSNPYDQYNNGQGGYPNGYFMPPKQRTISVGLIIFSIINIVFGCCNTIGLICGIIALVMTIQAKSAVTDQDEASKKKTALILNIVSIGLFVFAFIFGFMIGIFEALLYI